MIFARQQTVLPIMAQEGFGLVAAWKGVKEGKQLDMVCDSVRKLSDNGRLRADVNLGILEKSQTCADKLFARRSGVRP